MEQRIKAVIYARVSSEEQKKEGFSIPAQIDLLHDFARKNNIEIVKEFEEAETAKQAGGHKFNEMLKFLKKNKDVTNILCEKTDRLYRNFKDYVDLDVDTTGYTVYLVKEGVVLSPSSTSHPLRRAPSYAPFRGEYCHAAYGQADVPVLPPALEVCDSAHSFAFQTADRRK